MSTFTSERNPSDIQLRAVAAEARIAGTDGAGDQLEAFVSAAELYMQALRLTDNAEDRKRLDTKIKQLISKAEDLKVKADSRSGSACSKPNSIRLTHPVSTRRLTTREEIILLQGSKLNGATFKPWVAVPSDDEFMLKDDQDFFVDDFEYSLSETQLKHFADWKRPKDALALIRIEHDGQLLPNEATMEKLGTWDMVQDVAPDCSVIASFCVGAARAEKGHKRLFGEIVYPYDHKRDRPHTSPNGKYVLRLYFNGCWRRVVIDDRLPTSKSSRVLHVIDRSHPGLIWPTIAEKAYLKVRGGYDFPGSNSGTDLAVLTGWIPQQIFLHDEDVESQALWDEVMPAFHSGELMCTLGTGKLGRREQQQLGLGAEHDYAVLDFKETVGIRELLIKNPWADGDVWKGATRSRPHPGHEDAANQSSSVEGDVKEMKPGTFWMDFNHVFQYFEHFYLNWNPGLFSHRADRHFTWVLPEVLPAGNLLVDNPQFAVKTQRGGEIWILLNRHFRTGDYIVQNHGKNGYISLYLYDKNGARVFTSENARIRGPFVDSPNTLLRFTALPGQAYTLVAVSQDLPAGNHNFTISTFSNSLAELGPAIDPYRTPQIVSTAWTRATAGGSSDSPRYLLNPQFTLKIAQDTSVALVLNSLSTTSRAAANANIHVKLLIASSGGYRITRLRQRDTVAHSGDYRRGATVLERVLPKGLYTVICSTFEPDQLSKFELGFYTGLESSQAFLKQLPSEGSGRLSINTAPAVFDNSITKLIAPLTITRMTKALFKTSLQQGSSSALFKLSLEQGQGPYKRVITSSATNDAEYSPAMIGLRTEDVNLSTDMAIGNRGGLWLVLERPSQASSEARGTTVLQVEVLTEERIEIRAWAPLED